MKMHYRDRRLYVNAGMSMPACYARAKLLDTDKGRLPMTGVIGDVTCGRCLKLLHKQHGYHNMNQQQHSWTLGRTYGKEHPLASVPDTENMYEGAILAGCAPQYFDIFKYGAQSMWRRLGQQPGMQAGDLEPGDVFTVEPADSESPTRVCLTNDPEHGLRFGFPNKPDYWCGMGNLCPVTLVPPQ